LGGFSRQKQNFSRTRSYSKAAAVKGRHTKLAAEWGAKEVVGIDLGDGVESAFAATRNSTNAHIVQCDIFKLPFKKSFDYAFSIGVLHHTPNPKKGLSFAGRKSKKRRPYFGLGLRCRE
jgi:2-polyprenyl-3-methyl-5-hydroxy-6-metoxy-1,4-benzoquinol methylase